MPTLTTLVIFNGTNGQDPQSGLVEDSAGDLFGTTYNGGTNNAGTLFEISKTATGYASTPTILVNFSNTTGDHPIGNLSIDSAGDLFGTTSEYGPGISTNGGDGTVFELAKTATGYATTPTILAAFNVTNGATPIAGLVTDAVGDLFGTTIEGSSFSNYGTVFEIAKTARGYSRTPTTLATFNYKNGSSPSALTTDANGDLFGTTQYGGANGYGTVFEIAKTANGYAGTPTILFNFSSTTGAPKAGLSSAGLVTDAAGDLFGTTQGGPTTGGTVFKIAKTPTGYASTPTILVAFNLTDGQGPNGPLLIDGAGNLWGTTVGGAGSSIVAGEVSNGNGEVFEIAKTATGYARTPTIVAGLGPGQPNSAPLDSLLADAKGDLFATSSDGGTSASGTDDGTAFEVTNSGFVPTVKTVTTSGPIGDQSGDSWNVTANAISVSVVPSNTSPIFIRGKNDSVNLGEPTASYALTDAGQGTQFLLPFSTPNGVTIDIAGFQNDKTGVFTLVDQFASPAAAVAAVQSDGHGGSLLSLSGGKLKLDFSSDTTLTAANFHTGGL